VSADYRLLAGSDAVVRVADGAFIPDDPRNRDRAEYEVWLAAGGVPDPFVTSPAPAPSFIARDLFAVLTVDDFTAVKAAIAGNDALGLLWASLQAQARRRCGPTRTGFSAAGPD